MMKILMTFSASTMTMIAYNVCGITLNSLVVFAEKAKRMLDDTDSSKATGFDNIPPQLLKFASEEPTQPVTTIVTQSMIIYHFPHFEK